MEHPKERDWKSLFGGAVGNEKLKDPRNVASAFNNLFITINEIFNIHKQGKEMLSILKDSLPGYLRCLQIIPISEAEEKVFIIQSLKQNHVTMK
jgi:hypothetical protein